MELTDWHRELYARPEIGGTEPGRAFDQHLSAAAIFVAEIDGAVVGLAGLVDDEGTAELEPVVVAGAFRGEGVGAALVEAVIAAARKRGHARIRVRPVARNAAAIRFFRERGFDVLARVELQLDDREDWRDGEDVAATRFRV